MKTITIIIDESDKDYILQIGENQYENDNLIKTNSQNELWFHIDNTSGPHFVLQNRGDSIPKRYLNYIAGLFPNYKSNLTKRYNVIYTEIKNVKLTNVPGQVTVSNVKLIKM